MNTKGTRKLRLGRRNLPGQIYHVSSATRNRTRVFENLSCGRILVNALNREQRVNDVFTLAYVVMPDHFHWLLQLPVNTKIADVVNNAKSMSARAINQLLGTSGPIWQRGFYDSGIRSDDNLINVARYIVANPLRAGLVTNIGRYSLWDAVWVRPGFHL